ncbi:hypothetical protein EJ07DRAFT_185233 [Lizonia empirigonia]|nr:hypothetical protein EJ07DRAFT_185233 [Lizonia empirigonia]
MDIAQSNYPQYQELPTVTRITTVTSMDQFSRRNSRAYSTLSADQRTILAQPHHHSPRRYTCDINHLRRRTYRDTGTTRIPPHYLLAPTVPSPFAGTLESSLDAILFWKRSHPLTTKVADVLLRPVSETTNWPSLLPTLFGSVSALEADLGRLLLEDLLFLVTRTLLPEQIAENRAAMARLYHEKNHSSVRLVLRYDMLRHGSAGKRDLSVASVPPTHVATTTQIATDIPITSADR